MRSRARLSRARLETAVRDSAAPEAFVPAQAYDLPLDLPQADDALLDALAPAGALGCGNPAPVFYTPQAGLPAAARAGRRARTCS
jgi:single-stranded DNA-specific DHH superfamily exonuclease